TFTPPYQFNFKEKEQDGTNFYDYGARLYNPAAGRWLSPDSVLGEPRYAYVHNHPLAYVDPTGPADEPPPLIPHPEPGLPGAASYQVYEGTRLINHLFAAFDRALSLGSLVSPIGAVGHASIERARAETSGRSTIGPNIMLGLALIPDAGGLEGASE